MKYCCLLLCSHLHLPHSKCQKAAASHQSTSSKLIEMVAPALTYAYLLCRQEPPHEAGS